MSTRFYYGQQDYIVQLNLLEDVATSIVASATEQATAAKASADAAAASAASIVQSNWNSASGPSQILNKPVLATVATSGAKADVGLGSVDNTSDANKPISTAQSTANASTLTSAKSYADGLVVGLWDDRGNYDASVNTFPAAGGSGTSGAVLKGDLWTISVAGSLGGTPVAIKQFVRALIDSPAQAVDSWAIGLANTSLDNSITSGVTGRAPSQDAVSVALGLKTTVTTLATTAGAELVGFDATRTSVAGTVGTHFKGDVNPMDFPWLCKIDGVTDDTTAWNACVLFATTNGYKIRHPGGVMRITSGYTQSVAYRNLFITGAGRANEPASPTTSVILLDSSATASFFFNAAANMTTCIDGVVFKCSQYVLDRPFFKFTNGALHSEFFTRVSFEAVERPIVWAAGTYFQNGAFRDVQFRNSGTFHSESASLTGSLLLLDNVNHEGTVPVNSEKIVCNLQGVRMISAPNFLLEGTLPAAGWTILNMSLGATSSPNILTDYAGTLTNYHSEWSGTNQPVIDVNLNGMSSKFIRPTFGSGKLQVNNGAFLTVEEWVRVSDNTTVASNFTFLDTFSRVFIEKCNLRNSNIPTSLAAQLFFRNCTNTPSSSATDTPKSYPFSTLFSEKLYEWGGGIPRPTSRFDPQADSYYSVLRTVETNLIYGRIQRITRNGQMYPTPKWRVMVSPEMVGKPLSLSMLANFPVVNGGTYLIMYANWDGGSFTGAAGLATILTGTYVWQQFIITPPTGATYMEFSVGTDSGVAATDLLIAAIRCTCGMDTTPYVLPAYPLQVVSSTTAAPTTGTWSQGDRVINSTPTVGSPKAWVCTVTGTPGTWVSEGNL